MADVGPLKAFAAPAKTKVAKDRMVITTDPQRGELFEHGGADQRINGMVFDASMPDPLLQRAGLRAGILSSAIGIAGYTSIDNGRPVRIDEVVRL